MKVTIQPLNKTVDVEAGTNLLDALRQNDVPVSYSCTAGKCGVCRCKVVSGHVLEGGQEVSRPNSTGEGVILSCQSSVVDDCVIEIPEPDEPVMHPAKILKAKVAELNYLTHDIIQIRLKSAKKMDFTAGQYVSLQFSPDHIRPYSMAGLSQDNEMEFHVRLVPNGRVSSYIKDILKVGDQVRVEGPMGTSYLRSRHDDPILCIAGGTGLAPIMSVVRGALDQGMNNPIHVYFGALTSKDVYGQQVFQELTQQHPNLHFHVVVNTNINGTTYRTGLVTDAVSADIENFVGWRTYLAGSPPMVEAATLLLKRLGHREERIYADAFYSTGT